MPTPTITSARATPASLAGASHYYADTLQVVLEKDPATGDTMLPLPPDLCAKLDWQLDDELEWEQTENGFLLKNKTKISRETNGQKK